MKKKSLAAVLCLTLAFSAMLTGCTKKVHISFGGQPQAEQEPVQAEAPAQQQEPVQQQPAQQQEPVQQQVQESSQQQPAQEPAQPQTQEPAQQQAAPSGSYADLDGRQFTVNGKTYTLGVNTLQDMIDDGVPFDPESLANAGNNVDKNSESQSFDIVLGEYWDAQVQTINTTDSGKTAAELPLSSIFIPLHEDETQSVVSFPFPLNLTEDALIANAGQPTDRSVYEDGDYKNVTIKYEKDSETYLGSSGYTFEFTNGSLSYVTIDWMD